MDHPDGRVRDVNHAPTLSSIGNQSGAVNGSVSLAVSGSDSDGDPLTYTATGLPLGLSIAATTGTISGTLTSASAGFHNVTVTVSDGRLSATQSFLWTVTGANGAVPALRRFDYDGDGKADVAVFAPSTGIWSILNSSSGAVTPITIGGIGDVPVPGGFRRRR